MNLELTATISFSWKNKGIIDSVGSNHCLPGYQQQIEYCGSLLEIALFNTFINDLENGTEQTIVKFSDVTNWDHHPILLRARLSFRGTSSGWRKGLTGM